MVEGALKECNACYQNELLQIHLLNNLVSIDAI